MANFIKNLYRAISAKNKELMGKYRGVIIKNIQKLGFKIEEIIRSGKLISRIFAISVDNKTKEL
jgi:hypothetical protein